MDLEVVDAEEDAKEADVDESNFNDILEEENKHTFVNNGTSSDNDDFFSDLQEKDHVFNQKEMSIH